MLPDYLRKASPNPAANRAPWYINTAPSYAGIFLWIAFYQQMANGTLTAAGLGLCLVALAVAGLLCYAFYYRVPATLGMQTGYPLYVVGSSTFGATGGYLMPGLLMGLLQIGWFAVATFFSADFILKGLHMQSAPMTASFVIAGVLWGCVMAWIGAKGIQYVAKVSLLLNAIPLIMLLVVFAQTAKGIGGYTAPQAQANPFGAFTTILAVVIGFFATAGAAGADFGMNSRNEKDVNVGGLVGIALAVLVAGGLPLAAIAGAHGAGLAQGFNYDDVIQVIGGPLGSAMFILFLRLHRGQQLLHDDSRRSARGLDHGRRRDRNHSRGDGRGCESGFFLQYRRGIVRADLRRDGGRLSSLGASLGGPA
jgi:cytosine permease